MEYRIAKGWRIFAYIFGAAFFTGGFCFLIPLFTRSLPIWAALFIALFFIILGAGAFLDTMRTLVIIDEHALSIARLLRTRSALLAEIDGYRKGEKDTFFIVLKSGERPIPLPRYLERRKELIEWFEEKYEDIDTRELVKETNILLDNDQFGQTREERASRLAGAKKIDSISTVAGIGLFFWAVIYPKPFETLMYVLLAAPAVGVYITWYYKGLMRLDKKKSSPYPSMLLLILMTILAALLVVIKAYDLYGFDGHAWSFLLGITISAAAVCIAACQQAIAVSGKKALTYVVIVFLAGLFSFSLLVFSNCHYDRSRPRLYHVEVTRKWIHTGKGTTYHLKLSPWGKYTGEEELSVSKSFYQRVNTRDSVIVALKNGRWGLPWYFLAHGGGSPRINSQ